MITRLQFVILCRVEQGLPAFIKPLAVKTHPGKMKRRRAALDDLYERRLIVRVKGRGPAITMKGRRVLNWTRNGGEYGFAPYGKDGREYFRDANALSAIRQRLNRGEMIVSRDA